MLGHIHGEPVDANQFKARELHFSAFTPGRELANFALQCNRGRGEFLQRHLSLQVNVAAGNRCLQCFG